MDVWIKRNLLPRFSTIKMTNKMFYRALLEPIHTHTPSHQGQKVPFNGVCIFLHCGGPAKRLVHLSDESKQLSIVSAVSCWIVLTTTAWTTNEYIYYTRIIIITSCGCWMTRVFNNKLSERVTRKLCYFWERNSQPWHNKSEFNEIENTMACFVVCVYHEQKPSGYCDEEWRGCFCYLIS